jgi:hypothetical protein
MQIQYAKTDADAKPGFAKWGVIGSTTLDESLGEPPNGVTVSYGVWFNRPGYIWGEAGQATLRQGNLQWIIKSELE